MALMDRMGQGHGKVLNLAACAYARENRGLASRPDIARGAERSVKAIESYTFSIAAPVMSRLDFQSPSPSAAPEKEREMYQNSHTRTVLEREARCSAHVRVSM